MPNLQAIICLDFYLSLSYRTGKFHCAVFLFLYLIEKMAKRIFTNKEKQLVIITGKSFLTKPYQTHNASPLSSIRIIGTETCSDFFSFRIFIS